MSEPIWPGSPTSPSLSALSEMPPFRTSIVNSRPAPLIVPVGANSTFPWSTAAGSLSIHVLSFNTTDAACRKSTSPIVTRIAAAPSPLLSFRYNVPALEVPRVSTVTLCTAEPAPTSPRSTSPAVCVLPLPELSTTAPAPFNVAPSKSIMPVFCD